MHTWGSNLRRDGADGRGVHGYQGFPDGAYPPGGDGSGASITSSAADEDRRRQLRDVCRLALDLDSFEDVDELRDAIAAMELQTTSLMDAIVARSTRDKLSPRRSPAKNASLIRVCLRVFQCRRPCDFVLGSVAALWF